MSNTWEKRGIRIAAMTLSCLALLGPGAGSGRAQVADRRVTLNLKDVPLRSAIDTLFQGTGLQYAVDPNVPNVPVTLNLRETGLQAALRILIRQAAPAVPGLTSGRDGDLWVVGIRRQAPRSQTTADEAPPEFGEEQTDITWEKVPIQFNNVAVFVVAFSGQMLPTEADVLLGANTGALGGGGYGGLSGGLGEGVGGFGGLGGGRGGLGGVPGGFDGGGGEIGGIRNGGFGSEGGRGAGGLSGGGRRF